MFCLQCEGGILTWRNGFFENSDELHSVLQLPLSLRTRTVSVASQLTQRIICLPPSSVCTSHRAGSIGDEGGVGSPVLAVRFHSDGAGNISGRGAE